ncbi:hypothetical protein M1384_03210 [Candidatus Parvarchaeota archaeon]|nr:hypothetical protein [Candidatus Parvarchaeota archaeon]MCL5976285.1 hypothetical protein [Candidatus Parvarchaeota archaeon]
MENDATIKVLLVTIVLLAAFTAILYVYPFKPAVINQQNITNSIKLQNFLSTYNINLSRLSDKDLYYFYGGLTNNSIIFGCDYEMEPFFPYLPLNSTILQKEYNSILKDITLISMCSVENYTNCSVAEKQLYQVINESMTPAQIEQLFNLSYSQADSYYAEIVNSGLQNYSITDPLKYDLKLFNESTNISDMINTILDMKQMTVNIVLNGNGNMLDYGNETGVYSPFEFQVYRLINASSCSYSKIFNLVVDPNYFSSNSYNYLYRSLGNYTNICIVNKRNSCNSSEMKNLNLSFYAN